MLPPDVCWSCILRIQAVYTSLSPSTGLPTLSSSIFLSPLPFDLLLYIIAKSLLSSRLLPSYPSLKLFSLYQSLYSATGSGWSPCGTPCRVPNLFIISALCRDAQGMLKYTPPRSGYKWAGAALYFPASSGCPADTATGMDGSYASNQDGES